MTSRSESLPDFQREVLAFSAARDWLRFHDPKSLILALVGEVGELAELFQWVPADEAAARFADGRPSERVREELADVLIYLVSLANALDVDLLAAGRAKLAAGDDRFPVAEVHGVAPMKE